MPPTPPISIAQIGACHAVGFWAQANSLKTTTASKSAFICSLAVIVVPLADAVFGATNKDGAMVVNTSKAVDKKRQRVVFTIFHGPWFPALLAVR